MDHSCGIASVLAVVRRLVEVLGPVRVELAVDRLTVVAEGSEAVDKRRKCSEAVFF